MKTKVNILIAFFAVSLLTSCSDKKPSLDEELSSYQEVESSLKELSDFVTTEVEIQKVVIVDSENIKFTIENIDEWGKNKFGGRQLSAFVVVDTLQYGYDISNVVVDKDPDDPTRLIIHMPKKARLVNHKMNPKLDPARTVRISTGMRDEHSAQTLTVVQNKCINEINEKADSILQILQPDIRSCTDQAISAVMKSSKNKGWDYIVKYDLD